MTRAVRDAPDDAARYYARASRLLELRMFAEAARDADACLQLQPRFAKGLFAKGRALYFLQDLLSILHPQIPSCTPNLTSHIPHRTSHTSHPTSHAPHPTSHIVYPASPGPPDHYAARSLRRHLRSMTPV